MSNCNRSWTEWREMLSKAIRIAVNAHEGQVDKMGKPYIYHPLMVMHLVDTIDAKIVAVLHDVVEDTPYTIEKLREEGIDDKEILEAISYITKIENQPLTKYWDGVLKSKLATEVKLADIRHNTSPKRLKELDNETKERLIKKYTRAKFYLESKGIIDIDKLNLIDGKFFGLINGCPVIQGKDGILRRITQLHEEDPVEWEEI